MWNDALITNMFEFLQYFEFLRGHAPNVCFFSLKFEQFWEAFRNQAPQRFATKISWLVATSTHDWWYIFYPRPIFDPVMAGQMLNFGDLLVKIEVTWTQLMLHERQISCPLRHLSFIFIALRATVSSPSPQQPTHRRWCRAADVTFRLSRRYTARITAHML